MSEKLPLLSSVDGIADANGKCTIAVGPTIFGQVWTITNVSVQNTGALQCVAGVYKNAISNTTFIEGSKDARSDTSDTTHRLMSTEKLFYVFTGCEVGSRCMVVLTGEIDSGRN